ncbi:MAG: type II toxin-antitoxin system VapB family antitoxin [Balneolaceae bacterium]
MKKTAKIFKSGNSQAVRLPKESRFNEKEVYIEKQGDSVVLQPKRERSWRKMFEAAKNFSPDFLNERNQLPTQEREFFDE